ncbi:MAG: AAA-like domain-containing protein [Spirosomataceae bacterium]
MKNWIPPRTTVGNAATGNYYFERSYINEEIWYEVINKRNYVLMAAPRRMGKSSIMKNMVETCSEDCFCIYQNIEGISSKAEFYKRFYELIVQCLSKASQVKHNLKKFLESINVGKISMTGVEFKDKQIDFLAEIRNLLPQLNGLEVKIILFLDEFPEVIAKLKRKKEQEDAIEILHNLREWRHDEKYTNFNLVLAGSVGLHHVVEEIDRPKIINDLHPVHIGSLSRPEAEEFIAKATLGCTVEYTQELIAVLLDTINDYLPYYLNLMLEEINALARRANNPIITSGTVRQAFDNIVTTNRNFEDWERRLREYMPNEYPFLNEILKFTAHHEQIPIQKVYDIATRYSYQDDYMKHLRQIISDGYLHEKEKQVYAFVSPFLKQYWLLNHPVYHGN